MRITREHWNAAIRRVFNLWLLLGFFLCTGTILVLVNSFLGFGLFERHMNEICAAARSTYDEGGEAALKLVVRGLEAGPGMRVHLVDSGGSDVLAHRQLSALLAMARPFPNASPGPRPILIGGAGWRCVIEPPRGAAAIPFGPLWWVLPFVSTLCCTVGAYVTWRMRRIEGGIRLFGAGHLAVRVPAQSQDAIGRLAASFNAMAERIAVLVESHQRLCADMAHEIRSPLTRLQMALPLARRGAPGAFDLIEKESCRVNDLVDELLEVSRAEVDPATIRTEVVDLESLLNEIADFCSIEARDQSCEIELSFAGPGSLEADPELLRRAIENLVRNAIQHSPPGARIHVWSGGDAESAVVSVRDHGPGVPREALTQIFRPFYRVESARTRVGGGAGLGLAIASRSIALHRGSIDAENCSPGLRITVRLPRKLSSGTSHSSSFPL